MIRKRRKGWKVEKDRERELYCKVSKERKKEDKIYNKFSPDSTNKF